MDTYDPEVPPPSAEWLDTDEGARIELVSACHRLQKVKLPNAQLHAVVHAIVENQLALGEKVVVETLTRLQREGLTRHDAIHAIGSVLASDLYALLHEDASATSDSYVRYLEQLNALTAATWRAG